MVKKTSFTLQRTAMNRLHQTERLENEWAVLKSLGEQSTIFTIDPLGEPPTLYRLQFQGAGYQWADRDSREIQVSDSHEVKLVLTEAYPDEPPELEWLTPSIHPSLEPSAKMGWADLDLDWDSRMNLDLVCERIWDAIRGNAKIDISQWDALLEASPNRQVLTAPPVDLRSLRNRVSSEGSNVVKYWRKETRSSRGQPRASTPAPSTLMGVEESDGAGIHFVENDKTSDKTSVSLEDSEGQIWFLDESRAESGD